MNLQKNSGRLFLILSVMTSLILIGSSAAFAEVGMTLEATAEEGSTSIAITGKTARSDDISILVKSPNGNVVSVDQLTPDMEGNFATTIQTSDLWNQDGIYTITAQQGADQSLYKLTVEVEVIEGLVQSTYAADSSMVSQGIVRTPQTKSGLSMTADAVAGSTTIGISGHTTSLLNDITITVTAPNGNLISVDQIRPQANGDFETEIHTGSSLWKQDGVYTITAQQGGGSSLFKESVEVEIVDGAVIPEFGTVAMVILAVAIVSIIAVSARSRLSIIGRY